MLTKNFVTNFNNSLAVTKMKIMFRTQNVFLLVLAVGFTLASGFVQGRITQRWGPSVDSVELGKRLEAFPEEFGNWKAKLVIPLSDATQKILQCQGHINREYVNMETGECISVAIMLGPSGPISVHTPEVCYSSQGTMQLGERQSFKVEDVDGVKTNYWYVDFQSTGFDKKMMRAIYAWSTDGNWEATATPRLTFVTHPYLMKLQIAVDSVTNDNFDLSNRFLHEFVPALRKHLAIRS